MPDIKVQFPAGDAASNGKTNQVKTSKYTWLNFLPKNMYEQLHKFGNCYFLLISCIMYLGEKTPLYVGTIKAFSTVGVLVMMMAITATMALLDDLKRREADGEINSTKACFWPWGDDNTKEKLWESVAVGDILVVLQDEEFPADMVPFYCSGESGSCYVSTANLDGETNLKLKSASKEIQAACTPPGNAGYDHKRRSIGVDKLKTGVLATLAKLTGCVVAEEPNGNIHDFKGSLMLDARQKMESLGAQQLLLRGTKLRNTALVVGIVVYCGSDTRMIRNSQPAPAKLSSLEFFTNNSMKLILVAQGCLALLSSVCFWWNKWYFAGLWYLHLRNDLWLPDIPAYWLTFFTLYSNLMPISLYPTTEFCNAMQCYFIRNDKRMVYYAEDFDDGAPFAARARSSNLCQELGQIKYLFSDKTGTLTQNVMELKRLSIGQTYGQFVPLEAGFNGKEQLDKDRREGDGDHAAKIEAFLQILAVAHTVMVSKGADERLSYEAESPDEHALVKAASDLGWSFQSRDGDTLTCTEVSVAGVRHPVQSLEPDTVLEVQADHLEVQADHDSSVAQQNKPEHQRLVPEVQQAGCSCFCVSSKTSPAAHVASKDAAEQQEVTSMAELEQNAETGQTSAKPIEESLALRPNQGEFKVHPGQSVTHSYKVLATNAFTSARKRMSIVVKKVNSTTDEDEYLLFVKGADNVMFDLANNNGSDNLALKAHLTEFSREGLRTLVIGQKKLEKEAVEQWLRDYEDANRRTAGREQALAEAANRLEQEIELLGATAIEDKLQANVPETIEKIREAGIKLWVLTGDKLETARNIGFSTRVLDMNMNIVTLDNGEEGGDDLDTVAEKLQNASVGQAMMLTGKALTALMGDPVGKGRFLKSAQTCDVLIACRVSPMQKAELVRLIREAAPKGREPVTAAIGDGANDVPMIQEAQVGIGIAGREGRQSVNNSDFAIGQFEYLQRLLFVHGRWNYLRACKFTLFTFWRNMVQVLIMFSYTFFSGFSGTVLFEDWLRLTFNGFGTIPVLAVGTFDQDIPAHVACENPHLYVVGREGQELNVTKTVQTFIAAVVHAGLIVLVTWLAYPGMDMWGAGDYYTFGTAVYTCLIVGMTYRVAFLTCSHNKFTRGVIAFTLGGYVFFLVIYPCVSIMANIFEPNMYMVPAYMVCNASFWASVLAVPMAGWSVDTFTSWVKHTFFKDAVDELEPTHFADTEQLEFRKYDEEETQESLLQTHSNESLPSADPNLPAYMRCSDGNPIIDVSPCGQQELRSFRVKTTSWGAMTITFVCGLSLLLMGRLAHSQSYAAAQLRVIYQMAKEGQTHLASEMPWGTMENEVFFEDPHCDVRPGLNESFFTCNVSIPRDMNPPLLVYYAIGPFYQNLVTYIKSEVTQELMGKPVDDATREAKCLDEKSRERGGKQIIPCGTKAMTLFNDTLELAHQNGTLININKTGIAWQSDVKRYNNPDNYLQRPNTTWLYELFPDIVPKEEGVTNEAFAAWMRPAALGRVWNHYGWVEEKLDENDTITFRIHSSYNATAESSKFFVITERNIFGGRHTAFGIVLTIAGLVCIVLSFGVCVVHSFRVNTDRHGPWL